MIKPSLQLLRFSLLPRASEFSRNSVCICRLGRKQRQPSSSRVFTGSLAQTSRASWFPAAPPSLERSFLKVQAPLQLVGLPPLGCYLVSVGGLAKGVAWSPFSVALPHAGLKESAVWGEGGRESGLLALLCLIQGAQDWRGGSRCTV